MKNEEYAVAKEVGRFAYETCVENMCEPIDKQPRMPAILFDEKLNAPKYDHINCNLAVKPTTDSTESVLWLGRAMPRYFINYQSNGEYCGWCDHRNRKDIFNDRKRLMWEDGAEYRMLEKVLEEFRDSEPACENQKILREPSKLIERGLGSSKPELKVDGIYTGIGSYNYPFDFNGAMKTSVRRRISRYGWKKVREFSEERFKYLLKDKRAHEKLEFKDDELFDTKGKTSKIMIGINKGVGLFAGASILVTAANAIYQASIRKINPSSLYDLDYVVPLFSSSLAVDGILTKNTPEAIGAGLVYFTKLGLDMTRVFNGDIKPLIAHGITVPFAVLNGVAAKKTKERKEMVAKALK